MTIPLASNPAVINPKTALTDAQSQALLAIHAFRFNQHERRGWRVGDKTIKNATVKALIAHGLVKDRGGLNPLTVTVAGELASDKLKG